MIEDIDRVIRFGAWQDVLRDVVSCDVILADPPYSKRTHTGYRSGSDIGRTSSIDYDWITENDCHAFAVHWSRIVKHWVVLFCDHWTWYMWEKAWSGVGWYTFKPIVWFKNGAQPRYSGDGPASWDEWIFCAHSPEECAEFMLVARPKHKPSVMKSRPGGYIVGMDGWAGGPRLVGQKLAKDLKKLITDYTSEGDLIVDPFSGSGSMGVAAIESGRRYIGSEILAKHHSIARNNILSATPPMFTLAQVDLDQEEMFK